MPLTQVSFKTNPQLKTKALEKAEKDGITLKALLTMAMKAYVEDALEIGMRQKGETPSPFLLQAIKEAEDDRKRGDVMSFEDPNDAIVYLNRFGRKKRYAH